MIVPSLLNLFHFPHIFPGFKLVIFSEYFVLNLNIWNIFEMKIWRNLKIIIKIIQELFCQNAEPVTAGLCNPSQHTLQSFVSFDVELAYRRRLVALRLCQRTRTYRSSLHNLLPNKPDHNNIELVLISALPKTQNNLCLRVQQNCALNCRALLNYRVLPPFATQLLLNVLFDNTCNLMSLWNSA